MVLSPPSARRVDLPPPPRVYFDDSTVALAQRGSAEAWEVIYRHFGPLITGYARSRGIPDPEDVTQEVMSAAASRIGHFSGDSDQFRSWLFSIAHRRCADVHRRRYRRREDLTSHIPDRADPEGGADESFWAARDAVEAMDALAILDDREQQVITLRVIEERPVSDVSKHTGLTEANVRVIQSRAMAKLRRYVENNGGVLDKRFRGLPVPALALWERLRARFLRRPSAEEAGATGDVSALHAAAPLAAAPVVAISAGGGTAVTIVAAALVSTVVGAAAVSATIAPSTPPVPGDEIAWAGQLDPSAGSLMGLTDAEERSADPAGDTDEPSTSTGASPAPPADPASRDPEVVAVLEIVTDIPAIIDGSALDELAEIADLPGLLTSLGLGEAADLGVVGLVDTTAESALGAASDITEGVGEAVTDVVGTVTDTVDDVASVATEALSGEATVGETVEHAVDTADGAVDDVIDTTGELVEDVTDAGDDLVDDVVENVVETIDETVEETVEQVDETVTDVVDDLVGGLGGIIGN